MEQMRIPKPVIDDDESVKAPPKSLQSFLHTKKKRERRSKEEVDERNYICGCGKSYLSYAALYTHAKTKHDGIFPDGTTNLQKKSKGRNKNDWNPTDSNCDYQKTYEFNKEFQNFLNQFGNLKNKQKNNQIDLINFFPCKIFSNEDVYYKLLICLERMRIEMVASYGEDFLDEMDIIIFQVNNQKELNAYEILSLFLIYVFRFVDLEFYQDIVFFVVCYKEMMKWKGWEKIDEKSDFNDDFCKKNNCEVFPEFCNYFIMNFFSDCLQTQNVLKEVSCLKYVGIESQQLLIIILLIQKFCDWMNVHKYSSVTVEIYKD